jgi:3-hydroxyisobutyrate dehydrogenase
VANLIARLGFVGLGRMGSVLVPRLLACGFPVTVWNRTRAKLEAAVAHGAIAAGDLPDLVTRSDIVLTMLTDDAAVEAVYERLLSGDAERRLFVEMSTILPATIARLAPAVAAKGAALIDAPVAGSVGPAREGKLLALVGGKPDHVERARPVLACFSRRIAHLGPVSSGMLMKLALNMPMAIYWQGLAEALAMGRRGGLDLEAMLDLVLDSPAAIGALPSKRGVILGDELEVAFDVAGVRKDLVAMTVAAHALGVATPAGNGALAGFAQAVDAGWGDRDLAAIVRFAIGGEE